MIDNWKTLGFLMNVNWSSRFCTDPCWWCCIVAESVLPVRLMKRLSPFVPHRPLASQQLNLVWIDFLQSSGVCGRQKELKMNFPVLFIDLILNLVIIKHKNTHPATLTLYRFCWEPHQPLDHPRNCSHSSHSQCSSPPHLPPVHHSRSSQQESQWWWEWGYWQLGWWHRLHLGSSSPLSTWFELGGHTRQSPCWTPSLKVAEVNTKYPSFLSFKMW